MNRSLNLEAFVHASGDAIIAVGCDGKIVLWNPAAERIFGSFAESLTVFDEIISIDDRNILTLIRSTSSAWLRCFRSFDTVIDLEVYSKLTTVFSVLTAARNRIGFYLENTYWRRRIHTHLLFFNRNSGVFHFYEATAHLVGAVPAGREQYESHFRRTLQARGPSPKSRRRITIGHACSDFGTERMLSFPVGAGIVLAQGAG